MIYSSFDYVFLFLPIMLAFFFGLGRWLPYPGRLMILLLGSFYFYTHWMPIFLPLLIWTILFNFFYGRFLYQHNGGKIPLAIGVCVVLLPLLFFKYTNFIIANINALIGLIQPEYSIARLPLILPLGISFFTFQAIAYLVDCSRKDVENYSFLELSVFIAFWPQLIAGPILHHSELIPQLRQPGQNRIQTDNLIAGASLFIIGAAKKLLIADALAPMANYGFADPRGIASGAAILAAFCYTFQLYFDFSGYCDMAYGSARMFNIELPFNFLSPYKSRNMQEFWRHWHITLSRWLRDYIYIPLGGSRRSEKRTVVNLFLTFLIGGIWHGAGWTFVAWGILHGFSVACCHVWAKRRRPLPGIVSWGITMAVLILGWIFFRANTIQDALILCRKIVWWQTFLTDTPLAKPAIQLCVFSAATVIVAPNSKEILQDITAGKRPWLWGLLLGLLLPLIILSLLSKSLPPSPFLYFQF